MPNAINHGLRRNAEHYIDPTAYDAIISADKPRIGEIYSVYNKQKDRDDDYLIISVKDRYCNVLYLSPNQHNDDDWQIVSRCVKYCDVGRMSYIFNDLLTNYVKRLPYRQFEEIIEEFVKRLGIRLVVDKNGC